MPRLPALTALRFFAAFMVFLQHFNGSIATAAHGVAFFFVLSGFILAYSYPALPTWHDRYVFLVARFARIWPAHVTAMAFVCAIIPTLIFPGLSWWQVVTNLTMTQAWLPFAQFQSSINGPSWSISTEFFFYFCFLVLILDFQRTWHWKLAATFLMAVGLIALGFYLNLHWSTLTWIDVDGESLLYKFPLARLCEFTIGMCAALLWRAIQRHHVAGSRLIWTLAEVAAVLTMIVASRMIYLYDVFDQSAGYWFFSFSATLPAITLITIMAFQRGAISSLLGARPFVLLGELSYSFYLFHQVILYAMRDHYRLAAPPSVIFVLSVVTTLLVSYLVWWLIETPLRLWLRRIATAGPALANRKLQTA